MKLAGFLLLLAGWGLVLTALAILSAATPRTVFVFSGCAVELLGISLVALTYRTLPGEDE